MYCSVESSIDSVLLGTKIYWQCTARYKDLLTVYCSVETLSTVYCSVQRSIDSILLGRKLYRQCTARYKDLLTVYCSVQRSIDNILLGRKLYRQCTARYKDLSTVYCSVQCTGCTHRVPLGVKVIVEHRLAQVDLACWRVDEEVLLAQRAEAVVADEVLRHVVRTLQHQHGIGSQWRCETDKDPTSTQHRVTVTLWDRYRSNINSASGHTDVMRQI